MGRFSAWWASMPPTQRALVAIGVPLAALAAIITARRGSDNGAGDPTAATKAASATTAQYLAPPAVATGGGEDMFDALAALKDYVDEAVTTAKPTADPASYDAMPTHELFAACHSTGGATAVVDELITRGVSINDPRWKGANDRCLNAGVLRLMELGYRPPPAPAGTAQRAANNAAATPVLYGK